MEIIKFNYKEIDKYISYIQPYSKLRDYRFLFSSREWIISYLKIYKSENNYLFLNRQNYFVLTEYEHTYNFLGDSLNDFNGFCNYSADEKFNYQYIVEFAKDLLKPVVFENLFEETALAFFKTLELQVSKTHSIYINNAGGFSQNISKRIRQMYKRKANNFQFKRVFNGNFNNDINDEIKEMLDRRQEKLILKYNDDINNSFKNKFKELIFTIISQQSIHENFFIDICYLENIPISISFNFTHDRNVICYIRSHKETDDNISNGLVLDFWSSIQNDKQHFLIWDFTRGNESYKYRLGGKDYFLYNFKINNK